MFTLHENQTDVKAVRPLRLVQANEARDEIAELQHRLPDFLRYLHPTLDATRRAEMIFVCPGGRLVFSNYANLDNLLASCRDAARQPHDHLRLSINAGDTNQGEPLKADKIERRTNFLIDFDAEHAPKEAATPAQILAMMDAREELGRLLFDQLHWPMPAEIDSGNGRQMVFATDMPNDEETAALFRQAYAALQALGFPGVDAQAASATIHTRIPGSWNRKGTNPANWRRVELINAPRERELLTGDHLRALIKLVPTAGAAMPTARKGDAFQIDSYLRDHKLVVRRGPVDLQLRGGKSGTARAVYIDCPNCGGEAKFSILAFPNGNVWGRCFVKSCTGFDFFALRDKLEGTEWRSLINDPYCAKPERESLATKLERYISGRFEPELSIDGGEAFITLDAHTRTGTKHRATYAVHSSDFANWLRATMLDQDQGVVGGDTLTQLIEIYTAKGHAFGERRRIFIRIAEHEGVSYVDLGEDDWRILKLTGERAEVIAYADAPVRFHRNPAAIPFPQLQQGRNSAEDIQLLWNYVRCPEEQRPLVLGFLVFNLLKPTRPHPFVILSAGHNSGKSTTTRILKALGDPEDADVFSSMKAEDLKVAARDSWILTADNLSFINQEKSDLLCGMATGTTVQKRELYTSWDTTRLRLLRPVILNSINDVAEREDLLDRVLAITLEPFAKTTEDVLNGRTKPLTEEELAERLAADMPLVFSALVAGAVEGLRNYHTIDLNAFPRMMDFTTVAAAAMPAFGLRPDDLIRAYTDNQQAINDALAEDKPVLAAVIEMAREKEWTGLSLRALLAGIIGRVGSRTADRKQFPKTERGLRAMLDRGISVLRSQGVEISHSRIHGKRRLTIRRLDGCYELSGEAAKTRALWGNMPEPDGFADLIRTSF